MSQYFNTHAITYAMILLQIPFDMFNRLIFSSLGYVGLFAHLSVCLFDPKVLPLKEVKQVTSSRKLH